MASQLAHAAILRIAAVRAVEKARKSWKRARAKPTTARTRAAFRSCVFAARVLRQAANASPTDADAMLEEALLLDEAAGKLKAQLVGAVIRPLPTPT